MLIIIKLEFCVLNILSSWKALSQPFILLLDCRILELCRVHGVTCPPSSANVKGSLEVPIELLVHRQGLCGAKSLW